MIPTLGSASAHSAAAKPETTVDSIASRENVTRRWLLRYAPLLAVYILATLVTDAYFMGDSWIYVTDIVKAGSLKETFWDFGHPLWRPLGWLVSQGVSRLGIGADHYTSVTLALLAINWLAGLIGVVLVYALTSRFCKNRWLTYAVTAIFLFSNAILNYSQTAHSYVPGITLLFLGMYLLLTAGEIPGRNRSTALLAGMVIAIGVCQWLPLLFSIPSILLSPVFIFGFDKGRLQLALQTGVVAALLIGLFYFLMAVNLGLHDTAGLKAWVGSSAHGVLPDPPLKAIQRMFFALSRNLINMGNDGRLFKRFIVHDPFSPVTALDLIRLSLWKLGLFYVFLVSLLLNLIRSRVGKGVLFLLLLNAVPVLAFAVLMFESGSIDRYIPIFPMLFLALAVSMSNGAVRPWHRIVVLVFVAVVIVSNVGAMSRGTLNHEQETAALRIRDLLPLLKRDSRVITINQQDEAYAFNQNFPFNPINRSGYFEADILVDPGTTQIPRWRQIFANKTLALWDRMGDVWITKRVFAQRPISAWNWVEGDDSRVTWADIHDFFSKMETSQSVGGEDGFVLLPPSSRNRQVLSYVAEGKSPERDTERHP